VSHFGLVDLDTGVVSPLKEPTGSDFVGPTMAAFSPDGASVAYLYHAGTDLEAPTVLAVRATNGGAERIISTDLFSDVGPPPTSDALLVDGFLWPVWGTTGLLILPTRAWALAIELD
jgi:hypothetical protein